MVGSIEWKSDLLWRAPLGALYVAGGSVIVGAIRIIVALGMIKKLQTKPVSIDLWEKQKQRGWHELTIVGGWFHLSKGFEVDAAKDEILRLQWWDSWITWIRIPLRQALNSF